MLDFFGMLKKRRMKRNDMKVNTAMLLRQISSKELLTILL
jgi:hypothetical protein